MNLRVGDPLIRFSGDRCFKEGWHDLGGPIAGNGLTMSIYESTRVLQRKFYRVVVVSE